MQNAKHFLQDQAQRNRDLLHNSTYTGDRFASQVLPFQVDLLTQNTLTDAQRGQWGALEQEAARIALSSLASLAKIGELDHLGGGLELIPSLLLTLAQTNYTSTQFTIEHAHTSIGYYASLAALGFIDEERVIEHFRRSLDIAGHVSWVPGGTELNGGRLGVMVPVAVGTALGLKAHHGRDAFMVCHCGDAGWISGQALNGFLGADLHGAPIAFVMHRNGIQLSNTTAKVMGKDPRPIIASAGVEILEVESLHDRDALFAAYREARSLAEDGRPSLIFPTGSRSEGDRTVTLHTLGEQVGAPDELAAFAAEHGVAMETEIWIPGSLMSWRDLVPLFECVFHVNDLPGGEGHHDGHMKGRDLDAVLAAPSFARSAETETAFAELQAAEKRVVVTEARPAVGTRNLILSAAQLDEVALPEAGACVSPRAGSEAAYAALAKAFPKAFFTVSCDLDPSTKFAKAKTFLPADRQFEMSITEQVSALMTNGLAFSSREPQLNVFSTFAAFFEGIAREAMELWRYQRNLNGVNEGLNATMHLSHVGACTGRDHFSGWALDWISLAMGYLPYLRRFYAPADARAAFVAVKDLGEGMGGHIIGIPRDNVPVLTKQGSDEPLWDAHSAWEPVTTYRTYEGAERAILAFGCTVATAAEAAEALRDQGEAVDVVIVNGLPLSEDDLSELFTNYSQGLVTVEDGIIGTPDSGLRGFASLVQSAGAGTGVPLAHVGIVDPQIAPSHSFAEVWDHFGITPKALIDAVGSL